MTMNLKYSFDLGKVEFTDSELEMPYEELEISKEEIISGMELIMHIASFHVHPSTSDVADWGFVHSIAEAIYNELKENEDNE